MIKRNVGIITKLRTKSDKELMVIISALSGFVFFMIMDINNIFSMWNIIVFVIFALVSFAAYLKLRQLLRRN